MLKDILHKILVVLKKINASSDTSAISFNDFRDMKDDAKEFSKTCESLQKLLEDYKFDPKNVEKIDYFLGNLREELLCLESNISTIREGVGNLWGNYILPNKEERFEHEKAKISNTMIHQTASLKPLQYFKQREQVINLYKDTLFLIPLSNGYLTDDFGGLAVFNKDLSLRKIIHIGEGFLLDRSFMYKKFSSDEFIFYYFDFFSPEEYFIWYVNITTGEYKPIRYMGELNEFCPQRTYYWEDDLLFLVNFTGQFYIIDHQQGVLTEISEEYVQKNHPDFHTYAIDSLYFDVTRAHPQTYSFIFRDKEAKEIGLRNTKDDTTKIMKFFDPEVHDIRFHKDYFIFVQEKQIEIRKNKIKRVVIPAPSDYDFHDGLFIEDNGKLFVLALAGFYKVPRSNSLILYEITETGKRPHKESALELSDQ